MMLLFRFVLNQTLQMSNILYIYIYTLFYVENNILLINIFSPREKKTLNLALDFPSSEEIR